jgi:putative flippase GtrA
VLNNLLKIKSARYLLAGGWNTLFGYGVGVGLYVLLIDRLHITLIAIIANIISITMSFVIYKLYVFRSPGNWLKEYLRCYILYGSMACFGIVLLWIFVDYFHINIWFSQAFVIFSTVFASYFGHKFFTFKN